MGPSAAPSLLSLSTSKQTWNVEGSPCSGCQQMAIFYHPCTALSSPLCIAGVAFLCCAMGSWCSPGPTSTFLLWYFYFSWIFLMDITTACSNILTLENFVELQKRFVPNQSVEGTGVLSALVTGVCQWHRQSQGTRDRRLLFPAGLWLGTAALSGMNLPCPCWSLFPSCCEQTFGRGRKADGPQHIVLFTCSQPAL